MIESGRKYWQEKKKKKIENLGGRGWGSNPKPQKHREEGVPIRATESYNMLPEIKYLY
jgi:hypothetical protein